MKNANQDQKEILEKVKKVNGMIPNIYKNMVNLPVLQNTYNTSYHQFRKDSRITPAIQEAVFLAITTTNRFDYCSAAHSYLANNVTKIPVYVTQSIRNGKEIGDMKLKALRDFTAIMNEGRGNQTPDQAKTFLTAGYSVKHILSINHAQAVKTISNYSNHIFHTEADKAFAGSKLENA